MSPEDSYERNALLSVIGFFLLMLLFMAPMVVIEGF